MKFNFLWLFLLLTGCSETIKHEVSFDPRCLEPKDREKLAQFIIDCAKAANPMSDEEGEDLVKQCEWTGVRTLCPRVRQCREVKDSFMDIDYGSWQDCPGA